jgi:hypothetical protein
MIDRRLISQGMRLLPNMERIRETLRTAPPEEILLGAVDSVPPREIVRAGLEPGFEGLEETFTPDSDLPQSDLVANALHAERKATVEAGRRAIEHILRDGEAAELAPEEATGLEAIIHLIGRPAILIQDGRFFPPPAEWVVLDQHRDAIQRNLQSVGRIEVDGHPDLEWIGTGFLVAPDVLMTNRHVALEFTGPRADGRWGIRPGMKARIDFVEEIGGGRTAEVAIRALIGIHGRYDMALFRVARPAGEDAGFPAPLRLAARPNRPLENRNVYVVGYPAWDGRRNDPEPMLRLFGNIFNVKRLQPGTVMRHIAEQGIFTHDCSTLGGNSGSCVIDMDSHEVLGLHFGGRYREANQAVALWELENDPLILRAGVAIG